MYGQHSNVWISIRALMFGVEGISRNVSHTSEPYTGAPMYGVTISQNASHTSGLRCTNMHSNEQVRFYAPIKSYISVRWDGQLPNWSAVQVLGKVNGPLLNWQIIKRAITNQKYLILAIICFEIQQQIVSQNLLRLIVLIFVYLPCFHVCVFNICLNISLEFETSLLLCIPIE